MTKHQQSINCACELNIPQPGSPSGCGELSALGQIYVNLCKSMGQAAFSNEQSNLCQNTFLDNKRMIEQNRAMFILFKCQHSMIQLSVTDARNPDNPGTKKTTFNEAMAKKCERYKLPRPLTTPRHPKCRRSKTSNHLVCGPVAMSVGVVVGHSTRP